MSEPIKFTEKTKRRVAGRAGFRCSFPSCDKPTIGPGARSNETAVTGKAAHIYSASPGGPRGQGTLSKDQLRSSENAIWLCSDHATYVDTNRGEKFPPNLLLSYKALQEAKIARQQSGINASAGWFHELRLIESPIFAANARILFGKLTVIVGGNGSGKTALCEWMSGLGDPSRLRRWDHPRETDRRLHLQVTYFDPREQHARIEVAAPDSIMYYLEDKRVPFYPLKLGLVHLPQYLIRPASEDLRDELQLVSDVLRIPTTTLRNLIPCVNQNNEGCVRNLRLVGNEGKLMLLADHEGEKKARCFRETSDSQQGKVLIELCVAMARFSSEFLPTILMIEGGILSFDPKNFARYAEYFMSGGHHFQTIVMLIRSPTGGSKEWSGWEFVRLVGEKTSVTIDQSPF